MLISIGKKLVLVFTTLNLIGRPVTATLIFGIFSLLMFVINCLGKERLQASTVGNSTNIFWHKCSVERSDREELLQQKGCVVWITGLSGSGLFLD